MAKKLAPAKKVIFGKKTKKAKVVDAKSLAVVDSKPVVAKKAPRVKSIFKEVDAQSSDASAAARRQLNVGDGAVATSDKKGRIWLKWTENRIWVIFPQKGSNFLSTLTKADAVLTRDQVRAALKQERQMNVLPGLHDYPEALWDRVKEHEDVEMAINDGRLILVTLGDVGAKGDTEAPMRKLPETLEEVSTAMARELAEGCQDEVVLKRWLEIEKQGKQRGTVVTELEGQLALVQETEEVVQEANGR